MRLEFKFTSQFKKDLKLAKKQGKDLDELFYVLNQLAEGKVLEPKYNDHNLSGNYAYCRECHIEPDWLLIYRVDKKTITLILYRVGSHSDLF